MSSNFFDWLGSAFKIESGRKNRAQNIAVRDLVEDVRQPTSYLLSGMANSYKLSFTVTADIANQSAVEATCECADWTQSGGYEQGRLCKHLIALADKAKSFPMGWTNNSIPRRIVLQTPPPTVVNNFKDALSAAISKAIQDLAKQVLDVIREGQIPLLVGPTGCGKTSAIRIAAQNLGCLLVEHAGGDSWSDSDLVGVSMPSGLRFPGPVGKALTHAREIGDPVLLFMDEFTRYNPRAQEALMRLFLTTDAATTASMSIPHEGAIRITSAPFWGDEWAPAENIHIAAACNPWGTAIDPALARRVVPIFVGFDTSVQKCFSGTLANAIELSWKGTSDGNLPLPIEYGELSRAQSDDDTGIINRYLARLRTVDPAASEGFSALLSGTKP